MSEKERWILLEENRCRTYIDPEGWYLAWVKPDGCMELYHYFNAPLQTIGRNPDWEDQIHICDLKEFIERLQALQAKLEQWSEYEPSWED